jgi:hypothetical protein
MPEYTVTISRTIVETIEWVVPAASETVARKHAEQYLPLIQDDPEFLAGQPKHTNAYDWVIVWVKEAKKEGEGLVSRGGGRRRANSRGAATVAFCRSGCVRCCGTYAK